MLLISSEFEWFDLIKPKAQKQNRIFWLILINLVLGFQF
jgi:hypothetical protein